MALPVKAHTAALPNHAPPPPPAPSGPSSNEVFRRVLDAAATAKAADGGLHLLHPVDRRRCETKTISEIKKAKLLKKEQNAAERANSDWNKRKTMPLGKTAPRKTERIEAAVKAARRSKVPKSPLDMACLAPKPKKRR